MLKKLVMIVLVSTVLLVSTVTGAYAKDREYTVTPRVDGGYTLNVTISRRIMKPVTAEGLFPKVKDKYIIHTIGNGKNWAYRAQEGFYYGLESISSDKPGWDLGYAWIDVNRKYLYLNLYWVDSPRGLTPSDVNGKYRLDLPSDN